MTIFVYGSVHGLNIAGIEHFQNNAKNSNAANDQMAEFIYVVDAVFVADKQRPTNYLEKANTAQLIRSKL